MVARFIKNALVASATILASPTVAHAAAAIENTHTTLEVEMLSLLVVGVVMTVYSMTTRFFRKTLP